MTNTPKKGKYVKFKNYERKIKLTFMIYADFESILVPTDNGKHNPDRSYTNKYQKNVTCNYGYKLSQVIINLIIIWSKKESTAVM